MISPLKTKTFPLKKNGMRWNSLVPKNLSKVTKKLAFTKQLIKTFLWIVQGGRQGPLIDMVYDINQIWLLFLLLQRKLFSVGRSLGSWLATLACFICLHFLSADLSFPGAG